MTAAKAQTPAADRAALPSSATALSSAEIVEGVLRGQPSANAALYDTLRPVVVRSLQRVLREGRVDEDLVQTCFERIVTTLIRKQGKIRRLSAWAGAISTNVAVDALRLRVRERKLFELDAELTTDLGAPDAAGGRSPETQLEARHKLLRVQRILARMRPNQAQTMLLHDVFGHDLDEVAELTGVTPSAAQRRLSRARHELLRRAGQSDGRLTDGGTK